MIASVQAFILKQLLLESDVVTWKTIQAKKCDQLLVKAMIEIINQAVNARDPKYSIVYVNDSNDFASGKESSDTKLTEATINSDQDTSKVNQISETQATKQEPLESEVFHSQLRYVQPEDIYAR